MISESLKDFVLDQLRLPGDLKCRNMFGGHGFYSDGKFFGILFEGRLYLLTDTTTRVVYEQRGMKPFRPNAQQKLQAYYEVPADVIEDARMLTDWAMDAIKVARSRADL
jgi:TfoX/Sxy family transcriptional regulator of competence genes